jgi:mono/diheme cytochrome c family protein
MKKEPGMAYNTKTLNKIFAVISVVFLFAVVWMVLDDYIRPWKQVQIKALDIEQGVLAKNVALAEESIDGQAVAKLEEAIEQQREKLADPEVIKREKDLQSDLEEVQKFIYAQNMYNGTVGAQAGAAQFKYEHYKVKKEFAKAEPYFKKMNKNKQLQAEGKDKLKGLQAKEKSILNQIKALSAERDRLDKDLKKMLSKRDRLVASYDRTFKDPIWFLRNAPFIDYLDPTVKIRQVVIDNITDDRYFQHVPKVDRCMTCHVFIDQPGYEDQENPYKTHPKVESLAVGTTSAHPMKEFGCTSCHGGEGHRVNDFNAPVHMPQNLAQQKVWEKKHNWHEPHKIPQPMLPLQYTEASCVKCHGEQERISLAPVLNEGRQLIEEYGCYGCHKIKGWEHLVKPGPSLKKIVGKTNKEFIKNWIWAPHEFNPKAKMPAFFGQIHNSKPEFMSKNITEVNAMAEYLVANSKSHKPFAKYIGGDAGKGKALIQTIGCTSCHQVEGIEEPYNKVNARKANYLTGTGSKVDPDWLVSWLIKPSHYQSDTIMPSFRLDIAQANDIAAYLLSLRNKKFEELKFEKLNKKIRDELLVDYMSAFETVAAAKEKLMKMSDMERTLELGHRSLGKYGCYSCHDIEGFSADRPPIGPELTKVGSKPLEQFGFGQQKKNVGHTRHDWITAHLKEPAIWDVGVPKAFKDLNRMPNFYLSDQEVQKMVTVMLGQVSDYIPMAGKKILSSREKIIEDGQKVINKYNCMGCHSIDGKGGTINIAYEDDQNAGPPWLVDEGHRVYSPWLFNFLQNVHPIRPYLEVRMPSFNYTNDELNKIIAYFEAKADENSFENVPTEITWEPGERAAAVKMFNELACTSCHTGGFNNEEAQGPNLYHAKMRLRASWIEKWLTNPTGIMEYTPMPDFWEGGEVAAVEGVLGDDPKRQIKAMVKYVLELGIKTNTYPKPSKNYSEKDFKSNGTLGKTR